MSNNDNPNPQKDAKIVELRGAKVWRRDDGITHIQIQKRDILGVSDVVDMISTVYLLNLNQEKALILIQALENSSITKEARFLISRCSHITAAAIITKKSLPERLLQKLLGVSQKNYPFKSFSSPKLGLSWLSRFMQVA